MSENDYTEDEANVLKKFSGVLHWQHTKVLSCVDLEGIMSNLLGKTLTLLDATVIDPRQNKAVKDLTKAEFNAVIGRVRAGAMPEGMGESSFKLNPSFS